MKKSAALGISCSGGARRLEAGLLKPPASSLKAPYLRSGGTRPPFARDDFFTNSQTA
ncbi:MAG: hypothetical protein ACREYE_21450 [Gammaproteobacteria bacterium]